jgi:transposase
MEPDMPTTQTHQYIGVDIAKQNFVADLSKGPATFNQEKGGFKGFIKALPKDAWVVCEATAGYERPLVAALHKADVPISVIMPKRARQFARSQGILAKNDRIDARMLSRYGQASRLRPHALPSRAQAQLRELLQTREFIIENIKRETNLCEHAPTLPELVKMAAKRTRLLKAQLEKLEAEIRKLVDSDTQLSGQASRCLQVKGVGEVTVWTLLCEMPELGTLEEGQAAALLGVAPMCQESGPSQSPRQIQGGRPRVRRVIYMAALSAARCNPVLSKFYQGLRARGKLPKVALVAVMRKLIEVLNLILKYPNFPLVS